MNGNQERRAEMGSSCLWISPPIGMTITERGLHPNNPRSVRLSGVEAQRYSYRFVKASLLPADPDLRKRTSYRFVKASSVFMSECATTANAASSVGLRLVSHAVSPTDR